MAMRDVWVAQGLCRSCGGKKRCGTLCDDCRNFYNAEARERYKRRGKRINRRQQREYARCRRAALRARGLCGQCGAEAWLYLCTDCMVAKEAKRRKTRAASRAGVPEYRLADMLREQRMVQ